MNDQLSRRRFLAGASMGAAATVAAAAAAGAGMATVGTLLSAAPVAAASNSAEADVTAVGSDVVVHVRNASKGELSLMVGERELVYTDRALVARLLKGARQAGREA